MSSKAAGRSSSACAACARPPALASRRELLRRAGGGFGGLALAGLLDREALVAPAAASAAAAASARRPRARAVIWLFMEGGPGAMDTFDPKPSLDRHHGQRTRQSIDVFFGSPGPLMRSPFAFKRHGESGHHVCDRYPSLARHVDDIALVKSCVAESPNHGPAMYQMNTGLPRAGFPSVGSWVVYGLGSENRDLPGFVVFPNARGSKGGSGNWGHGFLPGTFQATPFRGGGAPILNLRRPEDLDEAGQRAILDLAGRMSREHGRRHPGEADLEARIQSYELAFRMQAAGLEVADLSKETDETRRLYGLDRDKSRRFGEKCLLARRLVERGVRFVQVYCDDEWDAHSDLAKNHGERCAETDAPIAGLLADLKRRGLLESTLVVWGGEFGRMPVSEQGNGRDHNPHGFLVWMAGGGVKGGTSYGETDEIGWKAAENPVTVHDLHATILHQLGIDHRRLTYLHNGRRFRLTDVAGNVITKIVA
jgi:uncharacterized protein (DUF1501 family)